jgi:K+ transporter
VPVSEVALEQHRAASRVDQPTTPAAALTAMGIVYGDLGTSPLYTLQAVAEANEGGLPAAAFGALSLIFWLLIVTISIKYLPVRNARRQSRTSPEVREVPIGDARLEYGPSRI